MTIPHRPAVMLPLWEWKTPYTMGAADYVRIPGEIPPRTVWVATKVVLMRTYDGKSVRVTHTVISLDGATHVRGAGSGDRVRRCRM